MRRRLFSLASLLSLMLCVATVVLWVRSDGRSYRFNGKVFGARVGLTAYDGNLAFGIDTPWPRPIKRHFYTMSLIETFFDESISSQTLTFKEWSKAGVTIFQGTQVAGDGHFRARPWESQFITCTFAAPLTASVFGAGSLYSVVVLISRLQRSRKHGHCRACGYNLTGNTSGVCPECGTACTTRI